MNQRQSKVPMHAGLVLGFAILVSLLPVVAELSGQAARNPRSQNAKRKGSGEINQPGERAFVLRGTEGDDLLDGGDGEDWGFGEEGDDILRSYKGDDTLDGGEGNDILVGGSDNDVLDGKEGNDILLGGGGDDFLDGGDGDDTIDGGDGNDNIDGGDDNDVLRGGAGDDILNGGDGEDSLNGGEGNDTLSADDGNDFVMGGNGDDVVEGKDGNDNLYGDAGDDSLEGGDDDDTLYGGPGKDNLGGGIGDDALRGGGGGDVLRAGEGADNLHGGSGNDDLFPGLGADTSRGGEGNDRIMLRGGEVGVDQFERIDGEGGTDSLILNGFASVDLPQLPAIVESNGDDSEPDADANESEESSEKSPEPVKFDISDPQTGGTYRLTNVEKILHSHLFPRVGSDASFLLINPSSSQPAKGQVDFYSDNGEPLAVTIEGKPAESSIKISVPPLGSVVVQASGSGETAGASARILIDNPLGGIVSAASPIHVNTRESKSFRSFIIPVVGGAATGLRTGLTIFNGGFPNTAKLTLFMANDSRNAVEVDHAEFDAPPWGQLTISLRETFPDFGEFDGTLSVEGLEDRSMAAIATQVGLLPDQIGTFPVVPTSPPPAAKTLHFPKFTSGGDQFSSLILINPSETALAKGAVTFFQEDGQEMTIAINGRAPVASVPFEVGPSGSVVFNSGSEGPFVRGSARATVTEGSIGGVLRLTYSTRAEMHVAPSPVSNAFVMSTGRNVPDGPSTEIVVSSIESAVELDFVLRTADGAEVPGGQAQRSLAANGQLVLTVDRLFPNVDTIGVEGTITVAATGGKVSLMAVRELISLPVARLRDVPADEP